MDDHISHIIHCISHTAITKITSIKCVWVNMDFYDANQPHNRVPKTPTNGLSIYNTQTYFCCTKNVIYSKFLAQFETCDSTSAIIHQTNHIALINKLN